MRVNQEQDDHPVLCESRSASPSLSINDITQSDYIINDRLSNNNNETEIEFESEIPMRPKLVKRDACHIPSSYLIKKDSNNNLNDNKNNHQNTDYIADFTVIDRYSSYPYIKYGNVVNDGFIRKIGYQLNNDNKLLNIIPNDIFNLINKYSYCEQDGIFQFGHFVCRIMSKLSKKKISFAFGVSGMELMKQSKRYIKSFNTINDDTLINYFNQLIEFKILRPIATNYVHNMYYDTKLDTMFVNKSKYLYEINQKTLKVFNQYIKYQSMRDRMSWNIGNQIEINSPSNGGWQTATISSINKKKVTVLFRGNNDNNDYNQMFKKTLNRFNNNKLRSTSKLIKTRQNWKIGDCVKVYSHSKHQWYIGKIQDIKIRDNQKSYIEDFKVVYNNDCCKYINRWSPDIQQYHDHPSSLMQFQSGQLISVWSNSQKQWVNGHIKVFIPMISCVLVKYGKSEKIININSKQLNIF